VVLFQPLYDAYVPMVRRAGGVPRFVRLEPPHWRLSDEALARVFNKKTRFVVFNNPLNPAAVVYPREDLELLARYCQEFDAVAICDEVVLFQPMYDAYVPLIRQAGGIPRFVRLEPPHWRLTDDALARVFNKKTRFVVFNNPLNPAAVVYPREDLELLARYCQEFDAVAICDEVWEHVVFDGRAHIPLIAIPGMRERTVKIGSAGKIFSLTGWKIGFVCAAPDLLRVVAKTHQFLTFTTPPNLQAGVAYGLGKSDDYFFSMRKELAQSRNRLTAGLRRIGFPVLESQGTYFLNVDLAPLKLNESDEAFCKRIVAEHKVAAIPVSAFYEEDAVTSVVRFCFAKKDATLDAALERLAAVMAHA
jgi:aspartate/methionine/tyrosine aminotransferase